MAKERIFFSADGEIKVSNGEWKICGGILFGWLDRWKFTFRPLHFLQRLTTNQPQEPNSALWLQKQYRYIRTTKNRYRNGWVVTLSIACDYDSEYTDVIPLAFNFGVEEFVGGCVLIYLYCMK